ncbi:MAG: hypothetical protein QG608_1606 [Actinomycetota bacterium]|nr:hypothetical protein [Actinomycetota bacterium]
MNLGGGGRYVPGMIVLLSPVWGYERRRVGRAGLAAPVVACAGVCLLAGAAHLMYGGVSTGFGLLRLIDTLVPVAAGLAMATGTGQECALELQLSLATAFPTTLARRFTVLLAVILATCVVSVGVMTALGQWHHPATSVVRVGVLLAPAVFLGGVGAWSTLRLRGAAAGSLAVITAWLVLILAVERVVHDWMVQKTLLMVVGLAFFAAALALARRGDQLMKQEGA